MNANVYSGEYRSAIARAKKILLAAGIPWSRTTGRYSPFGGGTQRTTRGMRVTRVGCSETVTLLVYGIDFMRHRDECHELEARALTALREAGMPFDDRGWLYCGRDARRETVVAFCKALRTLAGEPVPDGV